MRFLPSPLQLDYLELDHASQEVLTLPKAKETLSLQIILTEQLALTNVRFLGFWMQDIVKPLA